MDFEFLLYSNIFLDLDFYYALQVLEDVYGYITYSSNCKKCLPMDKKLNNYVNKCIDFI